jgi:DNA-binding response OmpR family regulator
VRARTDPGVAVVIEDDETIGRLLDRALRGNGYRSSWYRTGHSGLEGARREQAEVVLLDLGLPDIDGIDLARRLRTELPELLLIMLTARGEEIDIVAGLDAGADDYLVKPFSLTVLLARLRAHLRRRPVPDAGLLVRIADLTLDTAARRCSVAGTEVPLRRELVRLDQDPGRHDRLPASPPRGCRRESGWHPAADRVDPARPRLPPGPAGPARALRC